MGRSPENSNQQEDPIEKWMRGRGQRIDVAYWNAILKPKVPFATEHDVAEYVGKCVANGEIGSRELDEFRNLVSPILHNPYREN